eukprot:TRINITY_DN13241_c0_g1_i1.p1 TRINITY_DN13241_c0_g1~~TRINITY_DN13241_c0_g1_i1.p1  ORF type:complete len:195 (-),score=29.67 TRINITY_DN13241_c0_g1_i1:191-775(-)
MVAGVVLIAAHARNLVIGANNRLPWSIARDFERFLGLCRGNGSDAVIMGRGTWQELCGMAMMPFSDGLNVVVTQQGIQTDHPGCVAVASVGEALEATTGRGRVYVLGGEGIYSALLPHASWLRVTQIHQEYNGDVHFPEYRHLVARDEQAAAGHPELEWIERWRQDLTCTDSRNSLDVNISFVDYERITVPAPS